MNVLTNFEDAHGWADIGGKTPQQKKKAADKRRKKNRLAAEKNRLAAEKKRQKSAMERGRIVKPEPVDVSGGAYAVRTEKTRQTAENETRTETVEAMLNDLRAMAQTANVRQSHMESEVVYALERPIRTTAVESLNEAMVGSMFIKELNMVHKEAEKIRHLYDMIQESWDADVLVESKGASVTAYMALAHFQITFLEVIEKKTLNLREAVAEREAAMSILVKAEKTETLTLHMARRLKQSKKYMAYLKTQKLMYHELRQILEHSKQSLWTLLGTIVRNVIKFGSLEELQIAHAHQAHELDVAMEKLKVDTARHQDMVARAHVADKTKQAANMVRQSKETLMKVKRDVAAVQKTIKGITNAIRDRLTHIKTMSLAEKTHRRYTSRAIQEQPRYELRVKEFIELKRLMKIDHEENINRDINDYLELLISNMYFALEPVIRSRIWASNKQIQILLAVSNLRELESAILLPDWTPLNQMPPLRQLYFMISETLKKTYAPNVLISAGIYIFMDKLRGRTGAGVELGELLLKQLWESTVDWIGIAADYRHYPTDLYDKTAFNLIVYYMVMSYAIRQKNPWELVDLMSRLLIKTKRKHVNK